jgi:replicative DNA helicase
MSDIYNDSDYIELSIKALFRDRYVLQKAIDLKVDYTDFGTINIYNAFADTALSIGMLSPGPIGQQLCLSHLKTKLKNHNILNADMSAVMDFYEFVYNDEILNGEYILKNLAEFIKFRRYQTLTGDKRNTPEVLVKEATRLLSDIELHDKSGGVRTFDPFQNLVLVEHKESLMTGFPAVDAAARGLNYQEFGLILGHSGSGKTAMAVYSAIQNAKAYRKVLYLSLEEPAENICSRIYSNIFRIPYTDLHKGSVLVQHDLREAFQNMCERDKLALQNLKIHDLRDVTPITCGYIQNYLDKLYADTGYHPDLVYIDQLDYLTTSEKYDAEWQKYGRVSFEVDDLSNYLIGGKHMFSVWLLHQASGKMTRRFSNAEISGFKGVIKPTDMALAIGRDSSQDQTVSIFSLKARHAKNFQFDYLAELEFMNFEQLDKAAQDRVDEEEKDKKKATKGNFANIPRKTTLLPPAGTGFMTP